jgi:hypothetical protein
MLHRRLSIALVSSGLAGALAGLLAGGAAEAQIGGAMQAQPGGVRVQVFIDQRRNAAAKKNIGGQGDFPAYAYRMQPGNQRLELRLDNDELMQRWKGSFVLGRVFESSFESETQFAPVLLVVDVSNESGAAAQVAAAYLEVDASVTDRQPFMQLQAFGAEAFDLRNHGWGPAENAQLAFAFGPERPATETFTLALGSLGAVEVSPVRAMTTVVPALPALQRQSPRCRSVAQVRNCLAQLERTVPLGRLGQIAYLRDNQVMTRLIGTLTYQWRDAANRVRRQQHPVDVELQLFRFETGEMAEMGAPAPEESGFKPIVLALDRTQYRLPLPYRPRIGPGQNQRFQLTLAAPKSSQHLFRVVMEMTDGSRALSAPLDLLYFVPQIDVGDTRQVR